MPITPFHHPFRSVGTLNQWRWTKRTIAAQIIIITFISSRAHAENGAEGAWTLERALSYAASHNPDAELAEQRLLAARAGVEQAQAAFWPQLQLQTSYTYTNHPPTVFGAILSQRVFNPALDFNHVPATDNLNLRGTLTVPLYAGGGDAAGQRAAKAQAKAVAHQRDAIRAALALEVTRAFLAVLKAQAFIEATTAGVRAFESNLIAAQQRVTAGTLLRSDALDVEVRLTRAREDLVRARHAHQLAQRALRNALGIEQGAISVSPQLPDFGDPTTIIPRQRAESYAMTEQLEAAHAGLRRAKAAYQPRLQGFASLGLDQGFRHDGHKLSYVAGVSLDWAVFDGLLTKARVAQAQAEAMSAAQHARRQRLAIDLEQEQARLQLKDAAERLSVTQTLIRQAQESAELTRARFRQGLALSSQLIDTESALVAARVGRAEATFDNYLALATLRHAAGLPLLTK